MTDKQSSSAPEDFLADFLVRAQKRQAKLEEGDTSLQPASKIYHAERIVTSNDDEPASDADNPPIIKDIEALEVSQSPSDSVEPNEEQSDVRSEDRNTSLRGLYTIEDEDEGEGEEVPEDRSPQSENLSTKSPHEAEYEDDPLDLSEYLDGPILYRDDEPCEQAESETVLKEAPTNDLKYSLSIYRKENKHKTPSAPTIVYEQPSSMENLNKADNEELIKCYEDKIRKVTNFIKETGKALDLCYDDPKLRGTEQHLEYEKLLLESSFKQLVYSNEMAKIRQLRKQNSQDGTTGTIRLSPISLQLTNTLLQSTKEDKVLHCFLCLARCGPEVQCTELITSRSIRNRIIKFVTPLVFQNIPTNFQLLFEVYELVDEHPKSRKDLNFFAPLTPSKRSTKHVANMLTPSSLQKGRRTAFKSIGMLHMKLDQCQNVSFKLDHVPEPGSIDPKVTMGVTLNAVHTIVKKGMLHLLTESNEYPDWIRRWFVLKDGKLKFWRHPEDENEDESVSPPLGQIDLCRCNCAKVCPCSPLDDLYRQNSFVFYTSRPVLGDEGNNLLERTYHNEKIIKHQMATSSKDERNSWLEALNFAIDTIRRWRSNPVNIMDDAVIKKVMSSAKL